MFFLGLVSGCWASDAVVVIGKAVEKVLLRYSLLGWGCGSNPVFSMGWPAVFCAVADSKASGTRLLIKLSASISSRLLAWQSFEGSSIRPFMSMKRLKKSSSSNSSLLETFDDPEHSVLAVLSIGWP